MRSRQLLLRAMPFYYCAKAKNERTDFFFPRKPKNMNSTLPFHGHSYVQDRVLLKKESISSGALANASLFGISFSLRACNQALYVQCISVNLFFSLGFCLLGHKNKTGKKTL